MQPLTKKESSLSDNTSATIKTHRYDGNTGNAGEPSPGAKRSPAPVMTKDGEKEVKNYFFKVNCPKDGG